MLLLLLLPRLVRHALARPRAHVLPRPGRARRVPPRLLRLLILEHELPRKGLVEVRGGLHRLVAPSEVTEERGCVRG